MFTLTYVDLEYETSISILEFEMMIVVLLSFQLPTPLNPQNTRKLSLVMNSDTLLCIGILVFPIAIIEISTQHNWSFWHYFSSFHDYWPPTTRNALVHTSLGEMEQCEKRVFSSTKCKKKEISWNIKTKCLTDILLTVRNTSMKDSTCHYGVST